jgi:hypothetical protein
VHKVPGYAEIDLVPVIALSSPNNANEVLREKRLTNSKTDEGEKNCNKTHRWIESYSYKQTLINWAMKVT